MIVDEVVVYRSLADPRKIEVSYQGVLIFSPRGAESYFSKNPYSPLKVYFCIGETTAASISSSDRSNIVVAKEPNQKKMIESVIHHFQL
jgi:uroporphyrinogen-III synthase